MRKPQLGDELSGPHGPKFVGFGKAPKQPIADHLRYGLAIGLLALAFMAIAGVWP